LKYDAIVSESLKIFEQYNTALTLRQLYYRLVSKHIIDNTRSCYKQLSKMLVKARESGDVSPRWLVDRTRVVSGGDYGYEDSEGFIEDKIESLKNSWEGFTLPLWTTQKERVEVWVEKDALSKLCEDIADDYNVVTCPSKGYSSFDYVRKAVSRINRSYNSHEVTILYFGDYDPSGMDIERDLSERLGRYGAMSFKVERIALTLDQIVEHELPPMPAKTSDPRLARFVADTGGSDAVELDALEPDVLKDLIEQSIMDHLDKAAWDERFREITEEKEALKEKLSRVRIEYEED